VVRHHFEASRVAAAQPSKEVPVASKVPSLARP
jgi:hypothetical protein